MYTILVSIKCPNGSMVQQSATIDDVTLRAARIPAYAFTDAFNQCFTSIIAAFVFEEKPR